MEFTIVKGYGRLFQILFWENTTPFPFLTLDSLMTSKRFKVFATFVSIIYFGGSITDHKYHEVTLAAFA
jgi:hypothetical protein